MLDTSSVYDSEFDNPPQAQAAREEQRDPALIWMDPVDGFSVNLADQEQPKRGLTIEQMLAADPDILREARKKDPDAFQSHVDQVTEVVARDFRAKHPDYIASERNHAALIQHLCRTHLNADWLTGDDALNELHDTGNWTVGALTQGYHELLKAGALDVPAGTARSLSSDELLSVRATLKLQGPEQAIASYIRYALNGKVPKDQHALLVAHPELIKRGTATVFSMANNSSPQDLLDLRRARLNSMSLPTFAEVGQAWKSLQEERLQTAQVASSSPAPELDPSSLSDEELSRYLEAARAEMRKTRRYPSF